jgi:hypothetical protein
LPANWRRRSWLRLAELAEHGGHTADRMQALEQAARVI